MDSRFPMPPELVGKILRAAADPEVGVTELARMLEGDAVLSAQILRTVNSAKFGLRQKVAAVDRAIALMGIRSVRNLVLSLCVRDLVPTRDLTGFPLGSFWEASLRRGAAARCVAERLDLPNVEEYFTLGLCQDLGVLVQIRESADAAERSKASLHEPADRRLQIERERGEGHDKIGFAMFSEWSYPEELALPVLHHHAPEDAPAPHRLSARVAHAAEALSDLGFVDNKQVGIAITSGRLATLGLGPDDVGVIVERINATVTEFAALLGLNVEEQLSYGDLVAIASEGLANLNTSYEDQNRRLQESLSEHQRMAVEMARLNQELDRQARTDVLTGLPNRRAFDEGMWREIAVAQRQKSPLSLLLLDIDHFKQVNDRHGHLAGDRVLARIGDVVRKQVRESDSASRCGGEEFAVILPFTGETGARIAAERYRKAIEDATIRREGQELRITVSVGGATIESVNSVSKDTVASLFRCADEALYAAKCQGRNRVCWHGLVPEPA